MSTYDINAPTIIVILMWSMDIKDLASKVKDELFANEMENEEDAEEDEEEEAEGNQRKTWRRTLRQAKDWAFTKLS